MNFSSKSKLLVESFIYAGFKPTLCLDSRFNLKSSSPPKAFTQIIRNTLKFYDGHFKTLFIPTTFNSKVTLKRLNLFQVVV